MDRDADRASSPPADATTSPRVVINKDVNEEEDRDDRIETNEIEGDEAPSDEDALVRAHLMPQALPVASDFEPSDASGPALTAEEYLARVRYEADQCPAVVRVELDPTLRDKMTRPQTRVMPAVEGIKEAREELQPRPQWVQSFCSSFSALRDSLEPPQGILLGGTSRPPRPPSMPQLANLDAWEDYALGGRNAPAESTGTLPSTSVLQSMDQVTVTGLLERLVDRMHSHTPSSEHALWIFSLAARLEKPLFADTLAVIRSLLRNAASCRAALAEAADPALPRLNLLVALSGGYFCQDESLAGLMNT